jgi:hypothetical protein
MRRGSIVLASTFSAMVAGAQQTQAPPPDCSAAEHRQFDFWIGSWDVFNAQGKQSGKSEVTSALKGCTLHERWESTQGFVGESFSSYDRAVKAWHQTWVDVQGDVWKTDGGLVDGKMVLTREARSTKDPSKMVTHRWTWAKEGDADHVYQLAEYSTDGGKTWQTYFDGHYVRRK